MNTFKVLCVYDLTLVLLKWNGKMLVKWLSEQSWSYCSYIMSAMRTVYVMLVNETARLLHSYRDVQNMQDSYLNWLLRRNIYNVFERLISVHTLLIKHIQTSIIKHCFNAVFLIMVFYKTYCVRILDSSACLYIVWFINNMFTKFELLKTVS